MRNYTCVVYVNGIAITVRFQALKPSVVQSVAREHATRIWKQKHSESIETIDVKIIAPSFGNDDD